MDDGGTLQPAVPKQIVYENTFLTGPDAYGPSYLFKADKIRDVLKRALKERIEGQKYDPVKGSQQAKQLADDIREWVKALGFERHKLVIQVTLGQKCGQAQRSAARCLWDPKTDGAVSEFCENESLFCSCQVYCLYFQ